MQFWLLKSEPETWSWANQCQKGVEPWDGVRNYQAAANLKKMRAGDLALFYHSGKERSIQGIVQIVKEAYLDSSDPSGRFVQVDVETKGSFKHPVPLALIKSHPQLSHLALVRQSRLSVMPIDEASWKVLLTLGGVA
jgi:predicted RNA-binding protein with PUA-like domain